MKRRDFLKTSVIASAALSLNFEGLQAALSTNTVAVEKAPDMVAVMGGEPEVMLDKALEALGKERTKDRNQAEYRLGPLS